MTRLYQAASLVFILQLLPLDQCSDDALDRVGPFFQVTSDGIGHFVQQYSRWIQYAQTADSRDVLRDDVFRLCARMKKSLYVAAVVSSVPRLETHAARSFSTRTSRCETLYKHSCHNEHPQSRLQLTSRSSSAGSESG